MDILTFITKVVESIAWPVVVVAVLTLFRSPITDLINAIKDAKFKYSKGETTIEGELNTVRKKLGAAAKTFLPELVKKLEAASPSETIEKSWHDLEQTAASSMAISSQISPFRIADMLVDKSILSEKEAEAFYRLYEIKDEVTKPDSSFVTDVS